MKSSIETDPTLRDEIKIYPSRLNRSKAPFFFSLPFLGRWSEGRYTEEKKQKKRKSTGSTLDWRRWWWRKLTSNSNGRDWGCFFPSRMLPYSSVCSTYSQPFSFFRSSSLLPLNDPIQVSFQFLIQIFLFFFLFFLFYPSWSSSLFGFLVGFWALARIWYIVCKSWLNHPNPVKVSWANLIFQECIFRVLFACKWRFHWKSFLFSYWN